MTEADIRAQLEPGARILIEGDIELAEPLEFSHDNVTFYGNGTIYAHKRAIISHGIRTVLEGFTIWGNLDQLASNDPTIFGSHSLIMDKMKLNGYCDGVHAIDGAGIWISNTHINSHRHGQTHGIKISNVDTFFIGSTLLERHGAGVYIGGDGVTANGQLNMVTSDATRYVGFHIKATGSGSCPNIQMNQLWGSGAQGYTNYPIVMDGPTPGSQLGVARFSDFAVKDITRLNGATLDYIPVDANGRGLVRHI